MLRATSSQEESSRDEEFDDGLSGFEPAGGSAGAGAVELGTAETQDVVDFCTARNIKPDIELIGVKDIDRAYDRVVNKDVRYRFVIDMESLKTTA